MNLPTVRDVHLVRAEGGTTSCRVLSFCVQLLKALKIRSPCVSAHAACAQASAETAWGAHSALRCPNAMSLSHRSGPYQRGSWHSHHGMWSLLITRQKGGRKRSEGVQRATTMPNKLMLVRHVHDAMLPCARGRQGTHLLGASITRWVGVAAAAKPCNADAGSYAGADARLGLASGCKTQQRVSGTAACRHGLRASGAAARASAPVYRSAAADPPRLRPAGCIAAHSRAGGRRDWAGAPPLSCRAAVSRPGSSGSGR